MVGSKSTYIFEVTLIVLTMNETRGVLSIHKALSLFIVVQLVIGQVKEAVAI